MVASLGFRVRIPLLEMPSFRKDGVIFWTLIIMIVISVALSYGIMVLTAKSPKVYNAQPESDIDAPMAEEGVPVAVLFGTKRIKGPNVVWYGDIGAQAIQR